MRTPTGVRHNTDARAGTWRRQKQVQRDAGCRQGPGRRQTQHASQTREEEQAHTRYRSGTTGTQD